MTRRPRSASRVVLERRIPPPTFDACLSIHQIYFIFIDWNERASVASRTFGMWCSCYYRRPIRSPLRLSSSALASRRSTSLLPASPAHDFLFFPRFFDLEEQHALLAAALRNLDAAEPRASRKRRRDFLASESRQQDRDRDDEPRDSGVPKSAFLPDELYHFEEVRLVISSLATALDCCSWRPPHL